VNIFPDINNPCENASIYAVSHGYPLEKIWDSFYPSKNVQLAAVKYNPLQIKDVANQTEEMQIFALQKNVNLMRYIISPTKKVQELYQKLKAKQLARRS